MTSDSLLNGRYRLIKQIGFGGMGTVFEARDELLRRTVALKALRNLGGADLAERRKRAILEAQAIAQLNHPAIVRVYDVFVLDEDPWIVMEHIKGKSLDERICERGEMDEREIARIALPVLHGLTVAHGEGIVHRDVKPQNILVTADNQVFLVDFGIAKIDGEPQLTGYSRMLGTPEFMAPERLLGYPSGPPSDMWSLGVTLFYALEGYTPFARKGPDGHQATMLAIVSEPPPMLTRQGPLATVVIKLLNKKPDERPRAAKIAENLQAIYDGRPVRISSEPSTQRPAPIKPVRVAPKQGQTALTEARLQEAQEAIRRANPDTGVAMILAMSEESAAKVLAGLRSRAAGALIQSVANSKPRSAGRILGIMSSDDAGQVMDYVSSAVAATILRAMESDNAVRDATRIFRRTEPTTAAEIVMQLFDDGAMALSVLMLTPMPANTAAAVLSQVFPATVAAIFRASSALRTTVFGQLSEAMQKQVRRHL